LQAINGLLRDGVFAMENASKENKLQRRHQARAQAKRPARGRPFPDLKSSDETKISTSR
jgi:hypothetical protein